MMQAHSVCALFVLAAISLAGSGCDAQFVRPTNLTIGSLYVNVHSAQCTALSVSLIPLYPASSVVVGWIGRPVLHWNSLPVYRLLWR